MLSCSRRRIWPCLLAPHVARCSKPPLPKPAKQVAWRPYATAHAHVNTVHDRVERLKFDASDRVGTPHPEHSSDPRKWATLLEGCLPPHLRRTEHQSGTAYIDDPLEKAELILAARRKPLSKIGTDLLYDLAVTQGRWKAAVWLIKDLVDHVGQISQHGRQLPAYRGLFDGVRSFDKLTEEPISLDNNTSMHATPSPISLLDQVDGPEASVPFGRHEFARRDVLGLVWRSLGAMIMACEGETVRPEILEVRSGCLWDLRIYNVC